MRLICFHSSFGYGRDASCLVARKGGPSKQSIGRNQQGTERRGLPYRGQMVLTFTYRCPRTGLQVQGRVAFDYPTDCEIYDPVTCTACGRVHLVNPKSGKMLDSSTAS